MDAIVSVMSQGLPQEVVFYPRGIFNKLSIEREAQIQGGAIKNTTLTMNLFIT